MYPGRLYHKEKNFKQLLSEKKPGGAEGLLLFFPAYFVRYKIKQKILNFV